ncbi:T9SS type A sorting domain-containing protein [Flavobacterium azooxidireducens]|uniref:T9SS type A sorting domain-containing protein n=1 Tax=Flavobacterium azooxidireducens TaxID=1871076 RepID=A0ABY4KL53_9FLAO|nr:T9SS type A sorting domain-containing protein [Flavobacterium azooxidireducens]UPQ80503.1 T9SS type A sorting domain-containing protein [Flavobacterium azooxidireducens]
MKIFFTLLLFPLFSLAQTQIGADIDGEAAGDYSGASVSLSLDGNILAIGAPNNNGSGSNSGHVRIYENISEVWTQIGSDIDGEGIGDFSGNSVSLSSDGKIVAIGALNNDGNGSNSGHVRIYENNFGVWNQIGSNINGEAAVNFSGRSVSLSSDGNVVAIGASGNHGNGSNSGHVRIYENISGVWTQIGSDIDGEAAFDYSGYNVSLSSDGTIVAVGAYGNDENGIDSGQVKVYENISGVWTQIGSNINGEAAGDYSGISVSLSSDGNIIAIGAPNNDGNGSNSGHVRIYENISGIWNQIGSDINGEAVNDQSGRSVSLSGDGTTVVIGAPFNNGNGFSSGHVRIYKNISGVWTKKGLDINGEAANDQSGFAISLSNDGDVLAVGAYLNDGNGANAGHVRVFNITNLLSNDTFVQNIFLIYPNPSKENVTILIENDLQIEKVTIYNSLGQVVKTSVNEVINTSELAKGSYYLELTTNQGKATKTLVIN